MKKLFQFFIVLAVLIEFIYEICYAFKRCERKRLKFFKIHPMFRLQFLFAIVSFIFSVWWFWGDQQLLINCASLSAMVERGTFEALSSVMSIVGVGSIFFGWIYSDRDKLTLGKSHIDIIHYRYSEGYAGSIVVHFCTTALAIVMLKCAAREAALWSFFSVAWGCLTQTIICCNIMMNRITREKYALEMWQQDGGEHGDISVIYKMVECLGDAGVRYNQGFIETLGAVIKCWLLSSYNNHIYTNKASDIIKNISIIVRKISDKVPALEHTGFEEKVLRAVVNSIEKEKLSQVKIDDLLMILNCGYISYVYSKDKEKTGHHIEEVLCYFQNDNKTYNTFSKQMQATYCALEWFLFIEKQISAPIGVGSESLENGMACQGKNFVQMIHSMFSDLEADSDNHAAIAWGLVCK